MKKGITSAVIALLICLPIIYAGGIPFYILSLVIALLGFRELLNLILKDSYWIKLISYILFLFLCGSSIIKTNFDNILDYKIIGLVILIYGITALANYKNKKFNITKCFCLIGLTIFLSLAFQVMIITRNINLMYFIYLFIITIATDTFAHLIGTPLGKHKINEISPNKSWEGAIGGTLFGTVIAVLFYLYYINQNINIFIIIFITLFLSITGQFGDLFFSLIKRHYKVKDFSNIMPGHGGILDRLDSIIFVMIAFTYFITFL